MPAETVLITGASSGIGWELARRFAADGSRLILVARNEAKLRELAEDLRVRHGTESLILARDLSEPHAASRLFAELKQRGQEPDVLVNNAGFGQFGQFMDIPLNRHLNMLQLNMATLVELTHQCLPGMLQRRQGSILNLGSTASFQPGPNSAVYYASKAFVLSFSEALWKELQGTGVSVTCLCPGPTRTGFGADSQMDQTPVFRFNSMDVGAVADAGHRGLRRKSRVVVPGWLNNFLAWGVRFVDRRTMLEIMSWMQPATKKR